MLRLGVLFTTVSTIALAAVAGARAEEAEFLPEVSVSANRGEATPLTAVGSAVTIITAAELEAKQVRVISDALRLIPGVAVSRTGTIGNQTQVRIRGSEGNQTLVMIDGVVVNNPASSSEFDFGHLLTQDVERIEVLRGPQSALYGSDAVGGVINIITKKGGGTPTVTASLEGGSNATVIGNVSAAAAGEGFSIRAGTTATTTEGTSSAAKWRGNGEDDAYRGITSYVNASFDPLKMLGFDVVFRDSHFKGEYDDFGLRPGDTTSVYQYAYDANSGSRGDETFARGQARLSLLDGRWSHKLGLAHFRTEMDYLGNGAVTSSSKGESTTYDYQTDYSFDTPALAAAHLVTFAYEHKRDEIDSYVEKEVEQDSYVGQYQLRLFEDLSLTGAVRRDTHDLFEDATTFRLTSAYYLDGTGTKFRASYGTGVKNPTINELYGFGGSYKGNPDLKPEKGKGWDAGIDQSFFADRLTLGLTYFDQRITDEIGTAYVFDAGSGTFVGTPVNDPATSRHRGVEVELLAQPVEALTVRLSYSYTHARDGKTRMAEVRRPANQGSLDIGYRFLDGRASANLGLVYTGDFKDVVYTRTWSSVVYDMDSYVVANIAGSYRLTDAVEVFGRVENLFDENYEEVYSYGSLGRSAFAGVKATF
ncbi:TonB-dependent receptor plug domain-containing protein [Zavarzinia compransoris]|nr:TonB-dependent receptor [Zavarzinia compransoris]TDP44894.1 vitamin B12 transporter [Zavarzinia compransoris]